MVMQYVPARSLIVQVLQADATTWTQVEGMNQIGVDYAANEVMEETTTYADNGNYAELPMQRGRALNLQGLLMKDSVTGVQAPGQLRLQTLAEGVAYAGVGAVRFRHPLDTQWKKFDTTTVSVGEQGGGNNNMTGFSATVRRSGATTLTAAP